MLTLTLNQQRIATLRFVLLLLALVVLTATLATTLTIAGHLAAAAPLCVAPSASNPSAAARPAGHSSSVLISQTAPLVYFSFQTQRHYPYTLDERARRLNALAGYVVDKPPTIKVRYAQSVHGRIRARHSAVD